MPEKKILDLSTWNRKEHFNHFISYENPFFSIVSEVNCENGFLMCKREGISFFAHYLHSAMCAANEIEAFRMRIENDEVFIYDKIHAASTIGRKDGTFAFSFVPFSEDFKMFVENLESEIDETQNSSGLRINEHSNRKDVLHFTAVPWIPFTSMTHAHDSQSKDSIPKIGVGKAEMRDGKMKMPVSVNVHHALMDAYHVGQFLANFEQSLYRNY